MEIKEKKNKKKNIYTIIIIDDLKNVSDKHIINCEKKYIE